MYRITIFLFLCTWVGCSDGPVLNNVNRKSSSEIEDGGVIENSDRDKAERYLVELANVKSAEEEKKLLTEFGAWLRKNEYKIEVKVIDGKHDLSCPYFPPETPWVRHSFLDTGNIELLPRLDSGG